MTDSAADKIRQLRAELAKRNEERTATDADASTKVHEDLQLKEVERLQAELANQDAIDKLLGQSGETVSIGRTDADIIKAHNAAVAIANGAAPETSVSVQPEKPEETSPQPVTQAPAAAKPEQEK